MTREAVEVTKKIQNLEYIPSKYTFLLKMKNNIETFDVDDEKLLKDLTHEERISLSWKYGDNYVLRLWKVVLLNNDNYLGKDWIPIIQYNTENVENSYIPTFIRANNMVIDVSDHENIRYYRQVV